MVSSRRRRDAGVLVLSRRRRGRDAWRFQSRTQALALDADAWPERRLLHLYDFAGTDKPVVALARWNAKCRSFTEGWNRCGNRGV